MSLLCSSVVWGLIALTICAISTVVYRLVFHPLARFPGPKLAAITQWYEFYWNVIQPGQFTFHIETLHNKYGPIIRINPWELHVRDTEFYTKIYSRSRRDKAAQHVTVFDAPGALPATADHDLHKLRRLALNPFFSQGNVRKFAPYLQEATGILIERLSNEYKGTQLPANMTDMFEVFAGDTVGKFCFSWNEKFLNAPAFKSPLLKAFDHLLSMSHIAFHFPYIQKALKFVPKSYLPENVLAVVRFQNKVKKQIQDLMAGSTQIPEENEWKSAMQGLLESNLPPQEKTELRLRAEGTTLYGAGQSTARVLSLALFHLLVHPSMMQTVRKEIISIWPNPSQSPSLEQIENLPYLTAILYEALRLIYGETARSPRIAHEPLHYKHFTIPALTPISMTTYSAHHDENIFPDSHNFLPKRWLTDNYTINKRLTPYMVTFSKGSRQCIGNGLGWAQMFVMLATLIRRCNLEIYETEWEDVGFVRDYTVPYGREGSVGLRVLVKEVV